LLAAVSFLKLYRINDLLGFWYDQGRDGLVIWDLIHKGKFFLIGPTTGLPGVFRGPYYYYLIAPFYWLSQGNPVWPAVFLIITTILAVALIYKLGCEIQDKTTGLIAAIIGGFSFGIIFASRWLSNPTPMLPLSMILVWAMFKATEGKKWGWPVIALVSGLSLFNFGSSGELFYFPAIAIFLIWQWKNRPDLKNLIWSVVLFVLTFAPLVLFDFKHQHILLNNIFGTFGSDGGSFKLPTLEFIKTRSALYFDIFTNKIFQSRGRFELAALVVTGISFLGLIPKFVKNTKFKIVLLLLGSAIIGLYFYQGNYGILYDYYMTGYYLIFILFFAVVMGKIWKFKFAGPVFVLLFFYLFFANNLPITWSKLNDGCDGPESICLINQLKAIDWIYKDASGRDFNVDEYVPPVIPYAYQYLFEWLGTEKYHKLPVEKNIPLLYTLYEVDPPHPERLDAWLARQKTIGKVQDQTIYGGITVQRRLRIWYQQ
jgi:4-amino-4-deoxy-L-arabinose transferase-like glycosyltransferase